MGKKLKGGKRGEATNFISRAKTIRKLQLPLKEFRRLCILKGIYPREPPKTLKRNNKTYYHLKDINFLAHDRILSQFRDINATMKRYRKAKARGDTIKAKRIIENRPGMTLQHLIKERYPTFVDALKDLDDPLCLLNLFASFASRKDMGIPLEKIESCVRLVREFNLYVLKTNSLKKVFLSIKGI